MNFSEDTKKNQSKVVQNFQSLGTIVWTNNSIVAETLKPEALANLEQCHQIKTYADCAAQKLKWQAITLDGNLFRSNQSLIF